MLGTADGIRRSNHKRALPPFCALARAAGVGKCPRPALRVAVFSTARVRRVFARKMSA
jgi:hypothetical protein